MSFAAVFRYDVDPAAAARFEAVYGPRGDWAELFASSRDHLGTELWPPTAVGGAYLVVDRWRSEGAYEAFLRAHADEYAARSRATRTLYRREEAVGRFVTR